jgi:hypothetical protein
MMLILSACFSDIELNIKNNSSAEAWVSINGGEAIFINPKKTHTAYISSPQIVKLEYNGYHMFESTLHVDVNSGGQHVSLEPTAGAMRIHNSGVREIRGIYFSPASQNNWGADVLPGVLSVGEEQIFSLNTGYWDVKIVDQHNNYRYYTNRLIILDRNTDLIYFSL